MKTYLFNAINKYKKFSETLEVKKAICDKAWWIFNDSGEKELYIFQEDGTLYITLSGKVSNGTWKYIPANKSIIISANNQSYMVHAAFTDDCIFALQVDGTKEYAFLVDERNKQNFLPQTYSDVINYFIAKEQKYLEEQKRLQMLILQQEKKEERLTEEQERERAQLLLRARKIKFGSIGERLIIGILSTLGVLATIPFYFLVLLPILEDFRTVDWLKLPLLFGLICLNTHIVFKIQKWIQKKNCKNWKEKHPDDPVNEYLDSIF